MATSHWECDTIMAMQAAVSSPEQDEITVHLTKNRIVAVDIARILAAFSVMIAHLSGLGYGGAPANIFGRLLDLGVGTVSAIFFVFAGYFACRNITWKKAVVNAWWSFFPFLIWNGVALVAMYTFRGNVYGRLDSVEHIMNSLGMGQLIPGGVASAPLDGPLWFMRDLIFLFLLSPILFRLARYLFPALFVCALLPPFSSYICHNIPNVLSLYSLYFFTLGCFLRIFSKETQQKLLRFYSPSLIVTYWGAIVILFLMENFQPDLLGVPFHTNALIVTMGLWVLYQTARWMEVKSALISKLALTFAPITFLTFASHWIIWMYLPDFLLGSKLALLLPLADFALMSLLFFGMKRWCRPLLHAVAHYKLRPDDLSPSKKTSAAP